MKRNGIFALVVCLFCVLPARYGISWAAVQKPRLAEDPFKIHTEPFGPEIDGFQLGHTFEKFEDIVAFVEDRTPPKRDYGSYQTHYVIDAVSNGKRAGSVKFVFSSFGNGKLELKFNPESDADIPGLPEPKTLKEQQERGKWRLGDYLSLLDAFPNWVIGVHVSENDHNYTSVTGCYFLREGKNKFRLVSYSVGSINLKYRHAYGGELGGQKSAVDIASFVAEKFGYDDMEKGISTETYDAATYFYKNSGDGYSVTVSGGGFSVSPVTGDAIYPLFAGRGFLKTQYITEAESVQERDWLSSLAGFKIDGITDWIYSGYDRRYEKYGF